MEFWLGLAIAAIGFLLEFPPARDALLSRMKQMFKGTLATFSPSGAAAVLISNNTVVVFMIPVGNTFISGVT